MTAKASCPERRLSVRRFREAAQDRGVAVLHYTTTASPPRQPLDARVESLRVAIAMQMLRCPCPLEAKTPSTNFDRKLRDAVHAVARYDEGQPKRTTP